MEAKNLKISEDNWKWLMITKFDLGYDTADDLISKMKECFINVYQKKKGVSGSTLKS